MAKADDVLVVEIDGPQNENLHFRPLRRTLRGRFDVRRLAQPGPLLNRWPEPIPGQRLGIDRATGEGFLADPLRLPEYAATRAKVEKLGALEPDQRFPGIDVVTWTYWAAQAVDAGLARVVEGRLPEKIDGTPQTSFITRPPVDPVERLTLALEKQTEALTAVLAELVKKR